jgi:hypothetical protein
MIRSIILLCVLLVSASVFADALVIAQKAVPLALESQAGRAALAPILSEALGRPVKPAELGSFGRATIISKLSEARFAARLEKLQIELAKTTDVAAAESGIAVRTSELVGKSTDFQIAAAEQAGKGNPLAVEAVEVMENVAAELRPDTGAVLNCWNTFSEVARVNLSNLWIQLKGVNLGNRCARGLSAVKNVLGIADDTAGFARVRALSKRTAPANEPYCPFLGSAFATCGL